MKGDHATNGRRPSVQWQPFIEERRRVMLLQQQQQQQNQQHNNQQNPMASCACTDCYSNTNNSLVNASPPYWSPPTPVLSVYESPCLSQDDASSSSSPSSPSSTSWPYSSSAVPYQHYYQQQHSQQQQQQQKQLSNWAPAAVCYDRDHIVLPSLSNMLIPEKQEWPNSSSSTTLSPSRRDSGVSLFYS